ncbi:MAG: ABC transporter permease [Planctomycetota bacterium]|nr:MAG: ABC transporter permease [Planctomycetota bacterium]
MDDEVERSFSSKEISTDAGIPLTGHSGRRVMLFILAAALLTAAHIVLAMAWPRLAQIILSPPEPTSSLPTPVKLNPNINLALYVGNLFLLGSVLLSRRALRFRNLLAYAVGYAVIVWLLWPLIWVMTENLLLLVLAVLVYGSLLHYPHLLGYLYLFLVCQRFLPAYLYPSFILTSLLYTTILPFVRAWRRERQRFIPLCHLAGLILLTVLLIPIVFFCTQSSPQDIHQRLEEAEVLSALGISLKTSALATLMVLLLGVPFAYAMVRRSFPARGLIDTLIDLPIVIPPPIVGITLLAFLGPKSPLGAFFEQRFGVSFFDSQWGIILAQIFVGSPYLIRASMVAFAAVDVRFENVARTLGASSLSAFIRITLPMSLRGILIGVILTWFRAMAEFGALRIMANRPRTIPILAYERFIDFRQMESQSVGVLILLMCLCVIVGMWIIRLMPNILGKSIGVSDAAR